MEKVKQIGLKNVITIITPLMLLLLSAASCNGDVFVDDVMPSDDIVELSGDGDATVVSFSMDGLKSIRLQHIFGFPIKVYDRNGNLADESITPAEIGRVEIKSADIDMYMEPVNGGVMIRVNESLFAGDVYMLLLLDYGYITKNIEIVVKQCSPYNIIDITYDWDAVHVEEETVQITETYRINNKGDSEISVTFYPYRNVMSTYLFETEVPWLRTITDMNEHPVVTYIPTLSDGQLKDVVFDYGNIFSFVPTTVDTELFTVITVPGNTYRRYYLFIKEKMLRIPCRLLLRNPVNDNERTVDCKLTVTEPVGYAYGYDTVTDNEQ